MCGRSTVAPCACWCCFCCCCGGSNIVLVFDVSFSFSFSVTLLRTPQCALRVFANSAAYVTHLALFFFSRVFSCTCGCKVVLHVPLLCAARAGIHRASSPTHLPLVSLSRCPSACAPCLCSLCARVCVIVIAVQSCTAGCSSVLIYCNSRYSPLHHLPPHPPLSDCLLNAPDRDRHTHITRHRHL